MNFFEKLGREIQRIIDQLRGKDGKPKPPPAWDKCRLASCWDGAGAARRMMNILSPGMDEPKFRRYLDWMRARGCDTAHLILANRRDGEHAGYCIYGPEWSWKVNDAWVALMKGRIDAIRDEGLAVVLWLITDDSGPYAKALIANPALYCADLKRLGLLDQASTVVLGLELDEYWSAAQISQAAHALRGVYSGKIGTHQTSGRCDYHVYGDICFYQVSPGKSSAWIEQEARRVRNATDKPLNFFELERQPARIKCEAALRGGAFGVGNW